MEREMSVKGYIMYIFSPSKEVQGYVACIYEIKQEIVRHRQGEKFVALCYTKLRNWQELANLRNVEFHHQKDVKEHKRMEVDQTFELLRAWIRNWISFWVPFFLVRVCINN